MLFPENQNSYRPHQTSINAGSEGIGKKLDTNVEVRKDILSVSLTLYDNTFMDSAMYVYNNGTGGFYENKNKPLGAGNEIESVIQDILKSSGKAEQYITETTPKIVDFYNSFAKPKQSPVRFFGQIDAIAVKNEILNDVTYISQSFGRPILQQKIQDYIYIMKTKPGEIAKYYIEWLDKKGFTAKEIEPTLLINPQARIIISHELLQCDNNMIINEGILSKPFHNELTKHIEEKLKKILL